MNDTSIKPTVRYIIQLKILTFILIASTIAALTVPLTMDVENMPVFYIFFGIMLDLPYLTGFMFIQMNSEKEGSLLHKTSWFWNLPSMYFLATIPITKGVVQFTSETKNITNIYNIQIDPTILNILLPLAISLVILDICRVKKFETPNHESKD